jgi:hypothetical protein
MNKSIAYAIAFSTCQALACFAPTKVDQVVTAFLAGCFGALLILHRP